MRRRQHDIRFCVLSVSDSRLLTKYRLLLPLRITLLALFLSFCTEPYLWYIWEQQFTYQHNTLLIKTDPQSGQLPGLSIQLMSCCPCIRAGLFRGQHHRVNLPMQSWWRSPNFFTWHHPLLRDNAKHWKVRTLQYNIYFNKVLTIICL